VRDETHSILDAVAPGNADVVERLLLRIDEVSATLGIGRTKVFALVKSGELPVVRVGRSIRVPREVLREWIWQRTEGADESLLRLGRDKSPGKRDLSQDAS